MNARLIALSCLVLAIGLGCGRSLSNERGNDGTTESSTGGDAGTSSGTSGTGGDSAHGGVATAGAGQAGSSVGGAGQGGSSSAGTAQSGGFSGDAGDGGGAGERGDDAIANRLLLQTGNSLVGVDPETAETDELCPPAAAEVRYDVIDWANERAIIFRQHLRSPSAGELLRVALDGSECTSLVLNESILAAYSPVVGGRVVVATVPVPMSAPPAPPDRGDSAITRTFGLASSALDGSPLAVLVPSGVSDFRIVGEHVVFAAQAAAGGYDFFSALPDASSVVAPVPVSGSKAIAAIRGGRVVVNALDSADVYALDADGGNLAALAIGPEYDSGAGFVEDSVIIQRSVPGGEAEQVDLLSVDMDGGALVPIATSADVELFRGQIGNLVIYERAGDIYTARLDGSAARPVAQTALHDVFVASVRNRIIFGNGEFAAYFSVSPDGSDLVSLHESSMGLSGIAGDRAVFYVGYPNYDLVSVPISGGEPLVIADGAEPDWHVGTLGGTLIVQRSESQSSEGTILRIDADGSRSLELAASARYIGAVTQACGAVRVSISAPNDCSP